MNKRYPVEQAPPPQQHDLPRLHPDTFWDVAQEVVAPEHRQQAQHRLGKLWRVAQEEMHGLHPRLLLAEILFGSLPHNVGGRLKVLGLRMAGFDIGYGTMMWGMPRLTGMGDLTGRLRIGNWCRLNFGCVFDLGARITIDDCVNIGHQVMILTTTHRVSSGERRADDLHVLSPVTIGRGAWLGSRCTILPGITIGERSIIAAGSVVRQDVPPDTLVAGVPARITRELP